MNRRVFADSATVSEIGLGCWQLSGGIWGEIDDELALRILGEAMDHGIDFLDTADVYGGGRSERLIGRFLRESGRHPFVASKLGLRHPKEYGEVWNAAGFRRLVEDSLRNLGRDHLDLIQLHSVPTARLRAEETWGSLEELRRAGLVRFYGASVESVEQGLICLLQPGCRSLQVIFNIFRQKPAERLFEEARRLGVAIIARLPLASGLLGGRMTRATTFSPQDHRSFNRDGAAFSVGETFAGLGFETGVDLADELRGFVPAGMTMAEMALRWCLDFPEVTVLIPGATRHDQVRVNARASALERLPAELHQRLREFYRSRVETKIRGPY
jgi:aryl-alcohol dehydrogenase-like predicted oxidoreductase